MMQRLVRLAAAVAFVIAATAVSDAGGWVVVTVKDVPDHLVAGRSVVVTYAVRQHGTHLTGGLHGWVEAREEGGTAVVKAAAAPTSETGYYAATLTVPRAGRWTLGVVSGFMGTARSNDIVLRVIGPGQAAPHVSEADRGSRLFAAKGCATCHRRGAVGGAPFTIGPDLTARQFAPEFLEQVLAGRARSTSAPVKMPNLQLRESEVVSLVAFLNADSAGTRQVASVRP
jgi:mono/diheme cytochrome c family protein